MKILGGVAAILICFSLFAFGTTYEVGPGQTFTSIGGVPWQSLNAGDTVRIHFRNTPYKEKWVICRQGTAANPITVQGVAGPNGELPIVSGDAATTPSALNFWNEERGLIKIGGANNPPDLMPKYIVIENLELRSARPGYSFTGDDGMTHAYINNAASIYVEKVQHLTIRNCILHDSGNGLFIGPGADGGETQDVLVDGNYIYDNGNTGSIFEHNNYTASNGITFQYNHFGPLRAGCPGNNLKDRSANTVIRYNWIEGGNRQLDLVDDDGGGLAGSLVNSPAYVYGNVLIEPGDQGNSQIAHYGGDSGDTTEYRKGTLYFYNNTVISMRSGNTTLLRLSTNEQQADVRNNIIYVTQPGNRLALIDDTGVFNYRNNWFKTGYVDSHNGSIAGTIHDQGGNIEGSSPGFVNEGSQDFHLMNTSDAVNHGTTLAATAASVDNQYVKHQQGEPRPADSILDMGAYEFSVGISVSPLNLPSGTVGSAYDQTITASGGTGPYSFSVTSGSLPSGLSLSNSGVISGTPDTPGTSNFGVTATDSNSDTGNRNYSIQINDVSACLFCDDFNDNIVAPNWLYLKGTWNETGGELVGSHTGKADAIATPAFVGCDLCTNNVTLQLGSEPDAKVSVLGWYQNSKTYVELILVPAKDKLQLKQRVNNIIIAKGKGTFVLDPGVTYQVQIAFNGTDFVVSMNGNMLFSVPAAGSPTGTVGFRVKKASAKFDQISLN